MPFEGKALQSFTRADGRVGTIVQAVRPTVEPGRACQWVDFVGVTARDVRGVQAKEAKRCWYGR